MEVRAGKREDLAQIMEVIHDAQEKMHAMGIRQWINGYPDEEQILSDMEEGGSLVLTDQGKIIGTCFVRYGDEPDYHYIENGTWLDDGPYAVIHRIAVHSSCRGHNTASMFIEHVRQECLKKGIHSIRIDTHDDNMPMQHFLGRQNFILCGRIYLASGDPRRAYQIIF